MILAEALSNFFYDFLTTDYSHMISANQKHEKEKK